MLKKQLIRGLAALLLVIAMPSSQAAMDFLVDSAWLSEHKDDPKLVIFEVRYHPHRYYTVGHIPGAIQIQRFKDLGDNHAVPLMRFPSHEVFQQRLRDWGVNDDSLIVIYDDARTALASRLFFMLDLYGFNMEQVKLLNGGTLEWSAFEEMSKTAPPTPAAGTVSLKPANPEKFVEWTRVYDDVVSRRDPGVVLVDARPPKHYSGEEVHHAPRGGHIPGAVNLSSLDATDAQTQTWFDETRLAAHYQALPKDKTIYLYCHDGFRMSLAYAHLKALGYPDVRLLNGGWSFWGGALALPVVEGDKPYDESYAL